MTEAVEQKLTEIKSKYRVNTIVNVVGYVDRKLTQDEMAHLRDGDGRCCNIFLHSCKEGLYPMTYDEGSERTWGNIEVIRDYIHDRQIDDFKDLGVIGWDANANYGETVKVENIATELWDNASESEDPIEVLTDESSSKYVSRYAEHSLNRVFSVPPYKNTLHARSNF